MIGNGCLSAAAVYAESPELALPMRNPDEIAPMTVTNMMDLLEVMACSPMRSTLPRPHLDAIPLNLFMSWKERVGPSQLSVSAHPDDPCDSVRGRTPFYSSFVSHAASERLLSRAVTFLTCIQNVRDVILFPRWRRSRLSSRQWSRQQGNGSCHDAFAAAVTSNSVFRDLERDSHSLPNSSLRWGRIAGGASNKQRESKSATRGMALRIRSPSQTSHLGCRLPSTSTMSFQLRVCGVGGARHRRLVRCSIEVHPAAERAKICRSIDACPVTP